MQKVLLSMTSTHFHAILAFCSSDGSIDFRHRDDMSLIVADGDDAKVTSLPQNGFSFLATERCEFLFDLAWSWSITNASKVPM